MKATELIKAIQDAMDGEDPNIEIMHECPAADWGPSDDKITSVSVVRPRGRFDHALAPYILIS